MCDVVHNRKKILSNKKSQISMIYYKIQFMFVPGVWPDFTPKSFGPGILLGFLLKFLGAGFAH